MAISHYELCGTDPEILFSPNVWRTKMALAHKNLDFETIPWRFTEKDKIAFSGQGKVPVIKDNDTTVIDSWDIAIYLENAYPDRPSLFGGDAGLAGVTFIRHWVDTVIFPACAPLAVFGVWKLLDEKDQAYFRETREARFGKPLEDICGDPAERIEALRKAFTPVRSMLSQQSYLGGDAPLFSDHMAFAPLQWLRCVTTHTLFEDSDLVQAWLERMLKAYGGLAGDAKTIR